MRRTGPFTISDLEPDCPGVSRGMVRQVLHQMKEGGGVAVDGRGQGPAGGVRGVRLCGKAPG